MQTLQGQEVIIVGGSSGMGLATAQLAQRNGARVSITGLHGDKTESAAAKYGFARWGQLDVQDAGAIDRFFQAYERIDHVYVAAGSTMLSHILTDAIEPQIAAIDLRLKGCIHIIRAAASKIRPYGSFVFTGGLSTDRPVLGAWVSTVGTAAAEQLARSMALELAPVRANAVSPGFTDTPMWDAVFGPNKAAVLADVASKLPTRRVVQPDEVAEAVLLLMRNESITGEIIHVDGGGRLV